MPTILESSAKTKTGLQRFTTTAVLPDGARVPVHVVRYPKSEFKPVLIKFDEATRLLDWCQQNGQAEAMGGGFYDKQARLPLGELWIDGQKQLTTAFESPWSRERGSLMIDNGLKLGLRPGFADRIDGSLLQPGPLLVSNGRNVVTQYKQKEGFSRGSGQFDSDITDGRYPRSAIGADDEYIWSVACDGSSQARLGLALEELAEVMLQLGTASALNLDGGGSATQISDGQLINKPYGGGQFYSRGRAIYTAVVFEAA